MAGRSSKVDEQSRERNATDFTGRAHVKIRGQQLGAFKSSYLQLKAAATDTNKLMIENAHNSSPASRVQQQQQQHPEVAKSKQREGAFRSKVKAGTRE